MDLLSQKQYDKIGALVKSDTLTVKDIREMTEEYLEDNGLAYIDSFDTPCNFKPKYEYHQMEFYHYINGSGFAVDYGLTTEEELNDLTLKMEFLYTADNTLEARLLDLHVL